jgi:hypothetical protein
MTITIDPSLLPLGATRQWLDTVEAAGLCCQCAGGCGASHRASGGQCDKTLAALSGVRLYAVPAEPDSPHLIALCGDCMDKRERLERKAAKDAARLRAAQAPSLLDLLTDPEDS